MVNKVGKGDIKDRESGGSLKKKKKILGSYNPILPLLINTFASLLNRIDGIIKLSEGRADIVN